MTDSPGQQLARGFYHDVVAPLVPEPHAAALVGEGSEVLGLDDHRSADHAWGPRLHLFVDEPAVESVTRRMEEQLPETYRFQPVRFYAWQDQRIRHHVSVGTVASWLTAELRTAWPVASTAQWLALSQQRLLQVTAGPVFHDDQGELTRARTALAYFPDDVWWWLQASQWQLVADIEPLPGRLVERGDLRAARLAGARLAGARLAELVVGLAYLHERRYLPYAKWWAYGFRRLDRAAALGPLVDALLDATDAAGLDLAVPAVLEAAARSHNLITAGDPLDPHCQPFEVGINDARRPYEVLNAERFVRACQQQIRQESLRELPPVGGLDQLTHRGDLLVNFTDWPGRLGDLYGRLIDENNPGIPGL